MNKIYYLVSYNECKSEAYSYSKRFVDKNNIGRLSLRKAAMVKLVYTPDSGSGGGFPVRVRVPLAAKFFQELFCLILVSVTLIFK